MSFNIWEKKNGHKTKIVETLHTATEVIDWLDNKSKDMDAKGYDTGRKTSTALFLSDGITTLSYVAYPNN